MTRVCVALLVVLLLTSGCSRSGRSGRALRGVVEVTDANWTVEVEASKLPVLVCFGATWCGPCREVEPTIEAIASNFQGKIKVVHVDVDDAPQMTSAFGVTSIPRMVLLHKNRKLAGPIVGAVSEGELIRMIKSGLSEP
jgi:thioredoxin 1